MIGQPRPKKARTVADDDPSQEQTGNYTPQDLARDGGNPFNLDNPRILEIAPPEPKTLEETGLKIGLLSDIALKYLYYAGSSTGVEVAQEMCLPWAGVVEKVIDFVATEKLVDLRGGKGFGRKNSDPATARLRSAAARQVCTGCEDNILASQGKKPVSDVARFAMTSKSTRRSRYFPALSTPIARLAPSARKANP